MTSSSVPRAARTVRREWDLLRRSTGHLGAFEPSMVAGLPEPARRWLTHAIAPGTPLWRSVELSMRGQIRLGAWRPFTVRQVLAPPRGFISAATVRLFGIPVVGFDRLAVVKWPIVIGYDRSTPLFEGVVAVILTAMSLLAFLGLRYPVRLLPILLFESLWKLIWLGVVALPAVVAGDVDEAMREVIVNCSVVVIVFAVVPWRYVWQRYVTAKGDRWRGAAA